MDVSHLPPIESPHGDLTPFIQPYHDLIACLADRHGSPVVFCPNHHADCYGVAAALCQADPRSVRIIGWQHSDTEYDNHVQVRYEPIMSKLVGVSETIDSRLRSRLAHRGADICHVPYGVPVPSEPTTRTPLGTGKKRRELRLIYAGRMSREQKRISALVHLSDELNRRAVRHLLTLVGDGPETGEIDSLAASRPSVRRLSPVPPAELQNLLDEHDAFVMASKYEGLSVSLLEAMARGCVPLITRTDSGAGQLIRTGENGELADLGASSDDAGVAIGLSDAVERFVAGDHGEMSRAAWETARGYSVERHCDLVEKVFDGAAAAPPRPWQADRPCAFSSRYMGMRSGSIPPEAPERMRAILECLAGKKIVLHGAGGHTVELAKILARSPAHIVAITDDDRRIQGSTLFNWPVIDPADAGATGASDVVISSWMHSQSIWQQRGRYERQGLVVHKIYG